MASINSLRFADVLLWSASEPYRGIRRQNLSDVAMERARLIGYGLLLDIFLFVFVPFSKNVLFVQVIYKPFCCKLKCNTCEGCNNLLNTWSVQYQQVGQHASICFFATVGFDEMAINHLWLLHDKT